jgi:hypothetical protein
LQAKKRGIAVQFTAFQDSELLSRLKNKKVAVFEFFEARIAFL